MSLTAALIFNILAMLALLTGLAHVMSLPGRLEPYRSTAREERSSAPRESEQEERLAA
jgi:uncharacterized protein HemY